MEEILHHPIHSIPQELQHNWGPERCKISSIRCFVHFPQPFGPMVNGESGRSKTAQNCSSKGLCSGPWLAGNEGMKKKMESTITDYT